MKKIKLAVFNWIDACHQHGDVAEDEEAEGLSLIAGGLLKSESGKAVDIALDYDPEGKSYREVSTVLKDNMEWMLEITLEFKKWPLTRRKKR